MIFHITTKEDCDKQSRKDASTSGSFEKQGFIHCALKEQILRVANSRFRGRENLVLLCIKKDRLRSKLIFEDLSNLGEKHPHVYGVINKDSITKVVDFNPNKDGFFLLPEGLGRL